MTVMEKNYPFLEILSLMHGKKGTSQMQELPLNWATLPLACLQDSIGKMNFKDNFIVQ